MTAQPANAPRAARCASRYWRLLVPVASSETVPVPAAVLPVSTADRLPVMSPPSEELLLYAPPTADCDLPRTVPPVVWAYTDTVPFPFRTGTGTPVRPPLLVSLTGPLKLVLPAL